MIKRPVYPENPKSWFPVLVKYKDREEPCLVKSPIDLRDRVEFKVLKVRYIPDSVGGRG
jgi:hypothetical protein